MMNKKQLIAWIESLPDSMEVLPFELKEIEEDRGDWKFLPDEVGAFGSSVYQRKVSTSVALRVSFTGLVNADFRRDHFGNGQWANVRRAEP